MPFTDEEIQSLLAVKGIGKTILQRLRQMGLDDVAKLAAADLDDILEQGAQLTGSTCWKNSPQAKAAIAAAIECGKTAFSDVLRVKRSSEIKKQTNRK
ncbi:recombinase RecA [Neisseria sp. Marseille-Q5346]|uniref:recombinase RecA n=1 Tax=unclassified Neisseria TaxID=2623750 RepID=UPI0021DFC713|nr:recombinase RecA [Neisseria sp. Marseille-Q5346]